MAEALETLGFDWMSALAATINFLIVLLLLNHFLFGRIGKYLQERQSTIDKGLKDAKIAEEAARKANERAEKIIADAEKKANAILEKYKAEAEGESSKIKEEGLIQAEEIRKEAKIKAEAERKEILNKLKKDTADLALEATEKILEEKLDEKKDKNLIQNFLNKLS